MLCWPRCGPAAPAHFDYRRTLRSRGTSVFTVACPTLCCYGLNAGCPRAGSERQSPSASSPAAGLLLAQRILSGSEPVEKSTVLHYSAHRANQDSQVLCLDGGEPPSGPAVSNIPCRSRKLSQLTAALKHRRAAERHSRLRVRGCHPVLGRSELLVSCAPLFCFSVHWLIVLPPRRSNRPRSAPVPVAPCRARAHVLGAPRAGADNYSRGALVARRGSV